MKKAVFLAVLVGALVTAGIAFADHDPPDGPEVTPTFISGRVSNVCEGGQKLDGSEDGGPTGDLDSGTYPFVFFDASGNPFPGTIQIIVSQGSGGPQFTFITDHPSHVVSSIYVKGGPDGANLYNYSSLGGLAHDDGLHSPNRTNTRWYGLSHICVFADKK